MKRVLFLTTALAFTTMACGGSSSNSDKSAETPSPVSQAMVPTPIAQEVHAPISLEVDATNRTAWVYLDIDTMKIVTDADASWDLAFKRTAIKMNSASVTAMVSSETSFDAILTTPAGTYTTDQPVAGSAVETDGLFFHRGDAWYAYNMDTHVISSRNLLYVVKSNGGHAYKLNILDYYNADRLAAYIQLKFQQLTSTPSVAAE